jgi:hypothetical protein
MTATTMTENETGPRRTRKIWRWLVLGLIGLVVASPVVFVSIESNRPPEALIRFEDEKGRPVAGAIVTPDGLRPKKNGGHYSWTDRHEVKPLPVTTGPDGVARIPYPHFVFEQLQTGQISFAVDHPDFCRDRPFAVVDNSPTRRDPWKVRFEYIIERLRHPPKPSVIVLKRGGIWILEAKTEDGAPLKQFLHVQTTSPSLDYSTNSWRVNPDGTLECHRISSGSNWFRMAYLPSPGEPLFSDALLATASAGQTNRFSLAMKPGVSVEGKLSDKVPRPIGRGIVEVCAFAGGIHEHALTWSAWTNLTADGGFSFPALPPGRLEFIALCNGFVSENTPEGIKRQMQYPQAHDVTSGAFTFELPMEPTAACQVKVLDDQDKPLPAANVSFWPNERWGDWSATLLAQGRRSTESWLRAGPVKAERGWGMKSKDAPFSFTSKTDAQGIAEVRNLPGMHQNFAVIHSQFETPILKTSWGSEHREGNVQLSPGTTNTVTIRMQKKGKEKLQN